MDAARCCQLTPEPIWVGRHSDEEHLRDFKSMVVFTTASTMLLKVSWGTHRPGMSAHVAKQNRICLMFPYVLWLGPTSVEAWWRIRSAKGGLHWTSAPQKSVPREADREEDAGTGGQEVYFFLFEASSNGPFLYYIGLGSRFWRFGLHLKEVVKVQFCPVCSSTQ